MVPSSGRRTPAYVRTFATTNNQLALHLLEPVLLDGVRCEVTRAGDGIVRAAEVQSSALYGLRADVSFDYPSAFAPTDGSTPEAGEVCETT